MCVLNTTRKETGAYSKCLRGFLLVKLLTKVKLGVSLQTLFKPIYRYWALLNINIWGFCLQTLMRKV